MYYYSNAIRFTCDYFCKKKKKKQQVTVVTNADIFKTEKRFVELKECKQTNIIFTLVYGTDIKVLIVCPIIYSF